MYSLFQSNEIRLEYPLTLSTSKYAGLLLSKYEKFTPLSHKKELKCLCLHKLQVSYVKMCSENSNVCYTKAVFWYIKQGRGTWLCKAFCLCKVINFVTSETSEIGCGFWWRPTLQWIPPGGTVISLFFFPLKVDLWMQFLELHKPAPKWSLVSVCPGTLLSLRSFWP